MQMWCLSSVFLVLCAMLSSLRAGALLLRPGRVLARTSARLMSTSPAPAPPAEVSELGRLEIRIGKIVEIAKHPEADNLFVEKVDVGEPEGPRTIVSGLVAFCSAEQLLNSKVVVLCNLKPRALKGVTSCGMLLCASNADHTAVEPLVVPEGAAIGELVTFAGHKAEPEPPGNRASKAFTKVRPRPSALHAR